MFNNKCSWKTFKAVSLICFMSWFSFQSIGQEMELGIEYLKAGDYLKAKSIFQKLAKNKETAKSIYPQYYQTLVKLKDWTGQWQYWKK